jgi:hypothetical protein
LKPSLPELSWAKPVSGSASLIRFYLYEAATAAIRKQRMRSFGGADRDRTGDPLLAKQVLSQLSYSPTKGACN